MMKGSENLAQDNVGFQDLKTLKLAKTSNFCFQLSGLRASNAFGLNNVK